MLRGGGEGGESSTKWHAVCQDGNTASSRREHRIIKTGTLHQHKYILSCFQSESCEPQHVCVVILQSSLPFIPTADRSVWKPLDRLWCCPSPLAQIVTMVTHSGGGSYRWRCDDYDEDDDDGVGCQSLSPAASAFCIRPTILRPRPLSPTLGRHLPGEKSTQQELEGPGRLYVRSPEQGCARLICLSFFCSFYKKTKKKTKQAGYLPAQPSLGDAPADT